MSENGDVASITRSLWVAASLAPMRVRCEIAREIKSGADRAVVAAALPHSLLRQAEEGLAASERLGLRVIPFDSPDYPQQLKAIDSPPLALFVRTGSSQFTFPQNLVAIVGARAASVETCHRTSTLSAELARAGFTVVSGLALGVDGAAHRGTLAMDSACPTIAVVAHGLDRTYPSSHQRLGDQILKCGGAIVSEYPPGIEPLKHHFLERNRIIAGLSRGVIVVQAGERSGSLVTARCAADFGRDVFVVEGEEGDPAVQGGEKLLDDGAVAITSADEVLAEFGMRAASQSALTGRWVRLSLVEVRDQFGLSEAALLRMEIEGRVVRLASGMVSILLD